MKRIDKALMAELCDKANASDRKRAHITLHGSHSDPVQKVVIGLAPERTFAPTSTRAIQGGKYSW